MLTSPVFVRSLPFGLYIALLALEGLLPGWAPDFDVRWLYPVKAGLVALALAALWRHYTELKTWGLSLGHLLLSLAAGDRKSTRLNSSHQKISYAVFCLKKK